MGKLIVIEGATDGIGKTTQFNLLYNAIKNSGEKITSHHFPTYEEYQGSPATNYLKGDFGEPSKLSPYFVHSLYAIDRSITWYNSLKEKYDNGYTILLDRYTTSSIIYQPALLNSDTEKKQFMDFVTDYEHNKLGIPKPDKVIFLSAPFDLVTDLRKARTENAGVSNDIHERNLEFMKHVYNTATLAANYLNWDIIECAKDNKMKSIEEIHELICNKLNISTSDKIVFFPM